MTENKTLKNLVCLAVTLIICGSFLGAAETATARSRDNRDNSDWYIDLSYPVVEILPLTGYSLSAGYVIPKGGIKIGGGVAASDFFTASFAEVRLFPGNTFNIPLKIKWNELDRDALLSDDLFSEDTLGENLHADFIEALAEVPGKYVSYTIGLANEWQNKGGLYFGIEWLGFETGGFLPRIRLFQFTLGYSN